MNAAVVIGALRFNDTQWSENQNMKVLYHIKNKNKSLLVIYLFNNLSVVS